MIDPASYRAGLEAAAKAVAVEAERVRTLNNPAIGKAFCRDAAFIIEGVADAIRALPVPEDQFVAIRVRDLDAMSADELRTDIRRMERILQYLAAQHSGIPGSPARSDCMAVFASMALRGQG